MVAPEALSLPHTASPATGLVSHAVSSKASLSHLGLPNPPQKPHFPKLPDLILCRTAKVLFRSVRDIRDWLHVASKSNSVCHSPCSDLQVHNKVPTMRPDIIFATTKSATVWDKRLSTLSRGSLTAESPLPSSVFVGKRMSSWAVHTSGVGS